MRPWLSVIMPVYDGERYLAAALESVLSQARERPGQLEVIVSDDGSNDGSTAIVERFASRGPLLAFDGPRTGNWVANSNSAVKHASGQYLTFLHQDDLWLPGRLDTLQSVVAQKHDLSLWVSGCRFIGSSGHDVGPWHLPFAGAEVSVKSERFIERLLVQNFIGMPAPAFSRASFEAVGGMDESLWYTADWDLWLKLATLGAVEVSPTPTAAFRLHKESQTVRGATTFESMRQQTEIVRARHISRVQDPRLRETIDRAGNLASELNAALAAAVGGQRPRWASLASSIVRAGPSSLRHFARDARFLERSVARIRTGLALD